MGFKCIITESVLSFFLGSLGIWSNLQVIYIESGKAALKKQPDGLHYTQLHCFFMADLSQFDPNSVGNPNNNIFGLPFTEEDALLVLIPVPWEVTVSYKAGTARAPEHLFRSSLQVDLFDPEIVDGWKKGFFMRETDKKILLKSDYLRKEAELYINYISASKSFKHSCRRANKFFGKNTSSNPIWKILSN